MSATRPIVERRASIAGLSPISETPSAACSAIVPVAREQLLEVLRVLQRDRGMRGQFDQRRFVVVGEIAGELVDDFERAEHLAVRAVQRHAQQRAGLVAQLRSTWRSISAPSETSNAPRLAGVDHLAHDAGVVGNPQLVALQPKRRAADERVIRPVPQKDAGPVGREQPRGGFGHLHQQRFHLAGLVPAAGDLEDGFQPFDRGGAIARRTRAQASASARPSASEASSAGGKAAGASAREAEGKDLAAPSAACASQRNGDPDVCSYGGARDRARRPTAIAVAGAGGQIRPASARRPARSGRPQQTRPQPACTTAGRAVSQKRGRTGSAAAACPAESSVDALSHCPAECSG